MLIIQLDNVTPIASIHASCTICGIPGMQSRSGFDGRLFVGVALFSIVASKRTQTSGC
jgi:hypothetical protein